MRGTHNVDGIADPVIDALVEDVIAANSRTDLLTASKTLDRVIRSGRYWYRTGTKSAVQNF
jgi:microcin C transport system substrate-binding protein